MIENTNQYSVLGVDVGGSHISCALINDDGQVLPDTFYWREIDTSQSAGRILSQWVSVLEQSLSKKGCCEIKGIGIAMPGPFDYEKGVSLMNGVSKYHELYGINIKEVLKAKLDISSNTPILFENDAACFGLGESRLVATDHKKIIAITLGTGFGSTFISNNSIIKHGHGVPENGFLYNVPFENGIAEDYISSAWFINRFKYLTGGANISVKEIAARALIEKDPHAMEVFDTFGKNLAQCLLPWVKSFNADCLILGGSISKAASLFLPILQKKLAAGGVELQVKISDQPDESAMKGAAGLVMKYTANETRHAAAVAAWRKTSQPLMPQNVGNRKTKAGEYDLYPYFKLPQGKICTGYDSLAKWIISKKVVVIDGYIGNDWQAIWDHLLHALRQQSKTVLWYDASAFLRNEKYIDELVKPYLGTYDSVWGKKAALELGDFFEKDRMNKIQPDAAYDVTIIIGPGAALVNWDAAILYIDIPKNEIQYRMRAGTVTNLGKTGCEEATRMYKRFYFVDWPVMNKHRRNIKDSIEVVADGQWKDEISWTLHTSLKAAFQQLSASAIRVRPWFEAGAWGGQWMKERIPGLNKNEINYAWSFELIVPENGLAFELDGHLLEVAFDWLMEFDSQAILGNDADFGTEFPIRFDFLDTFDGGNLSVQCHPGLSYIQQEFGENITQDETYYILDCKENAEVYLGFQDDIDPTAFRAELEKSVNENIPIEINKYVQSFQANKHDLFLIPNQTIHCSGKNNMVLEISATPYIFTFKMYDWLRLDLNGKPRPINIGHAFKNLDFSRKGDRVKKELISTPRVLEETDQWRLIHLPTHPEHFYDVHRIEFLWDVAVSLEGKCHILMLVEGQSIEVVTENGYREIFSYAETFIIPAAAGKYYIYNKGKELAKVIKAFIK